MGRWRPPPARSSPYITPAGFEALQAELQALWLRRRDVVRALFKLAATVGRSWGGTHVLVAVNHENALMYERVGFEPVGEKTWVQEIGNEIVPMVSTFSEFYARTVGVRLDGISVLKCFSGQFQRMVYRAGERVFSEFDEADECYVIDEGSVRITTTLFSKGCLHRTAGHRYRS